MEWMSCEHEALAIASGVNHFSPYIRDAKQPTQVLTDCKPCVLVFQKMCKGHFSASARVSTFLSTLSTSRVTLAHIKGVDNPSSDFASRNPQHCASDNCQVCNFIYELIDSVVCTVTVSDVISGSVAMPFTNHAAWKSAQHDCPVLRRAYAHLTQGTRPAKKRRNIKDLKRILQVATVSADGLLVVKKDDPFVGLTSLIVVPSQILPGLLTAMHIFFEHATKFQLTKLFSRYFYGLNSDTARSHVLS